MVQRVLKQVVSLSRFFRTTSEELTNYLTFQHMLSMASATTKYMRSLDAEFQSIFTGVNAEPPRQVLVFDFFTFNLTNLILV